MIKRKILIIVFVYILITALTFIILIRNYTNSTPKENILEKECTLIKFERSGGKGGISGVYEYFYNGINYMKGGHRNYVKGSKFNILIDSINPEKSTILYEKPIIKKNEIIDSVYGIVWEKNILLRNEITFEYSVQNHKYSCVYKLPKNHEEIYTELNNKTSLYKVEYVVNNPERAKIYLNNPIKYFANWRKYKYIK